ncbi:MAG TPA: squalene--hopene cyclase [Alphaproteobacteria bacterium]
MSDRLLDLKSRLDPVIAEATAALKALQRADGHWVFELEADATIPAEYIMLEHYLDEIDGALEEKLAAYLRGVQGKHGGWPLFHDGDFNISTSVKAYLALKLAGDDPAAAHMVRAREAILVHGGAARCNVFTRFALALFGQVPWRAVPVMPVEIMLLPRWFPFHLSKVSYWSRTVIVPLLILTALKPKARNPRNINIQELFVAPPETVRDYQVNPTGAKMGDFFLALDKLLQIVEPFFPKGKRDKAIHRATAWVTERLNGEDGLGAIFPAMANSVMAFEALGYPKDHPDLIVAKESLRKLLITADGQGYCQPCVSPVWDTGLAALAIMEAEAPRDGASAAKAMEWLAARQILNVKGDWADLRPGLRPGGWAFQYGNDYYPDVDDTALVGMALDRVGDPRHREGIERAAEWIIGMQSENGGWGSFDADNTKYYLNHIPFADHGALLDPPTADVSARCLGFLAQLGYKPAQQAVAKAIEFLKREQETDGSWFGRWGTNYIYGTWSVLSALNGVGENLQEPYIQRAVAWLKARQGADGGWGEDGATYWKERRAERKESTASQTAWAVLGLMAAGEVDSDAVRRGIEYLLAAPRAGCEWREPWYTAVGFPRIFYLRYHGYRQFFPLWALARYRNLMGGNDRTVQYGI